MFPNQVLHIRRVLFFLPVLILSSSLFLSFSPAVALTPQLGVGISIDLTLLMPVTYFLAIRKTKVPNTTVIPVFVLSILLANTLLPVPYRGTSAWMLTFAIPALEVLAMGFIVYKTSALIKAFPKGNGDPDFYVSIRQAASAILPEQRVSNIFATEIAMIFYSFFSWKKSNPTGFSHHKKNGILALLWAVIMILLVETFVLHLFLVRWNAAFAWIIFGLSLYTCLQIFAHIKALKQRRSYINEGQLHLKYGLFGDTSIALDTIAQLEWTKKRPNPINKKEVQQLAMLGELESHNLILHLKEPAIIFRAYGIQKSYQKLMLQIDDQIAFEQAITQQESN